MLVPAALVAGVAAAILISPRGEDPGLMGLEEALQTLVAEPVPAFLLADEPDAALIRMALEGG